MLRYTVCNNLSTPFISERVDQITERASRYKALSLPCLKISQIKDSQSKLHTPSSAGLVVLVSEGERSLSLSAGGRSHDVADPLDAPREHHVPAVHHRERRVEPRSGAVGNLHLRQAALVPALQQ